MRTTFDLPRDVTEFLRRESVRRGGRAKAPMNLLVSEAVRSVFGPAPQRGLARIEAAPGRGFVRLPKGVRITDEDVAAAMEDMR